jgi:hypothetical protein
MLGFLNMSVQIVEVVQPGRVLVVLNNRQITGLGESSQLARTHAQIQSCFFRSQKPSSDVARCSHLFFKNLGTMQAQQFSSPSTR